ncbi:MAG: hypothetical protein IPL84_16880 [Chitinophagaceae bacterium]|nr:hypothetical protein [Chitinophagaceae bacterium]
MITTPAGAIYWFDAPSGGTLLISSDTLNTGRLFGTTNYYAVARGQNTSSLFVYAILPPTPVAPRCRTVSQVNYTVNPIPSATITTTVTPSSDTGTAW